MTKTILITGGAGMVGTYFSSKKNCVVLSRSKLDVRDVKQIEKVMKTYAPRAVIHLAAMTNVDYCETHPEEAYEVNAIGAKNMALACEKNGSHFVFVSTAAVFSGKGRTPFTPDTGIDPVNVYARSKAVGELFTRDLVKKHTIVRTGWLFGGYESDHKFVGMIARQIWEGKKEIKAIATSHGCPTYTGDLVDVLLDCIEKERYGIVQAVNGGNATRLEIVEHIAKTLKAKVKVKKVAKQDLPSYPAPRPQFEVMKQTVKMRHWKKALSDYIHTWEKIRQSPSSSSTSK